MTPFHRCGERCVPLIKAIRWQSTCFWKAGRRGTEDSSCSQAVRSQPWTVKSPKSSPANPPTTRQRTVSKSGPCGSGSVLGDTLGSVSCEIFRLHRGEALAEPWGLREEGPRTVKDKRAKRVIEEDRQAEVLCHGGPTPLAPDGAFGQDVTWKGATTVLSLHAPTPTPAPRGGGGGGGGGGEQSSVHLAHSGPSAEEAGCSEVGPGCWGAVPSLFPSPGSQPGAPPRSPEVDSRSRPRAARGSEARIRADAAWVLPVTLQDEIIETMVPKK